MFGAQHRSLGISTLDIRSELLHQRSSSLTQFMTSSATTLSAHPLLPPSYPVSIKPRFYTGDFQMGARASRRALARASISSRRPGLLSCRTMSLCAAISALCTTLSPRLLRTRFRARRFSTCARSQGSPNPRVPIRKPLTEQWTPSPGLRNACWESWSPQPVPRVGRWRQAGRGCALPLVGRGRDRIDRRWVRSRGRELVGPRYCGVRGRAAPPLRRRPKR
jgi:hypothetical protein